jgi:hypothetical protein
MPTLKEAAREFLGLKTIAVAGVSSTKKDAANYIYEKLKQNVDNVYAINPNATEVEGDPAYPDLSSTPTRPDGVVICTSPAVTLEIVRQCAEAGVKHAWIHKSVDKGSYSREAEDFCKDNGIDLIPAGCPMMYCEPVDFPHKCIKWVLHTFGRLPKSY